MVPFWLAYWLLSVPADMEHETVARPARHSLTWQQMQLLVPDITMHRFLPVYAKIVIVDSMDNLLKGHMFKGGDGNAQRIWAQAVIRH